MPHSTHDGQDNSTGTRTTVEGSFSQHGTSAGTFSLVPASGLRRSDILHDLIAVGFGPASLAIAIAIHDGIENSERQRDRSSYEPKVRFLEKQASFGWHTGTLLQGTKMQISFLKDLATMRNPRSRFTFLNYLKEHQRLAQFSNLSTFLPLRTEFEDYLKWSANHFGDIVDYSQNVLRVRPLKIENSGRYNCLEVLSEDVGTGAVSTYRGRNIVIAVGGQPYIPPCFASIEDRFIHSSKYKSNISEILPSTDGSYDIAIIGAGQSAAEIFLDLQTRYPKANVCMLIRDTALRPSDDSPFVNEIFNPEEVDTFFSSTIDDRRTHLTRNKPTNYSVVRLELLEEIYARMYQQRLRDRDSTRWQHKILTRCEVVEAVNVPHCNRVDLITKHLAEATDRKKTLSNIDAVILATGYVRNSHEKILSDCHVINGDAGGLWRVDRDYRVKLNRELVSEDVQIYLRGCNENTHGLSDTLLSNLATRGGEVANSIFGAKFSEVTQGNDSC